jgi:hypothetical protein
MKFDSKKQMAQELLSGKRFKNTAGLVIHYDTRFPNPFRCGANDMIGVWNTYNEDIWTEVKSHHAHQNLIDSYQEGQAWQYMEPVRGAYRDCKNNGVWVEPDWEELNTYRLHPHNEIIQKHRNGAKIQAHFCGNWVDDSNPCWHESIRYRVKPTTEIVYEWMFKPNQKWVIMSVLMSEEEAKKCFDGREYRKTGRSWEEVKA